MLSEFNRMVDRLEVASQLESKQFASTFPDEFLFRSRWCLGLSSRFSIAQPI